MSLLLESLWINKAVPAGDQYRAACEGIGLFDLTDREHVELRGADRAKFLHNFCTQEINRLAAGTGAEAFLTNIKGRILGHVLVFVGEEAIWLDAPPGCVDVVIPHLDRYLITEDVQIADRSADWGEVTLIGQKAAELVDAFVPGAGQFAPCQHGHQDGITVRRFDFSMSPGWLIGAAREQLPSICERLAAAGAVPGRREVFEALRIEAAFPLYGTDLTEDNLAQEAGRTRQAISFTKGCYLGQEPIARLDAMGHTNRELRRVRLESAVVPAPGTKLIPAGGDRDAGEITSAALSPVSNVGVALAMLRREACEQGTHLEVVLPAGRMAAVVE